MYYSHNLIIKLWDLSLRIFWMSSHIYLSTHTHALTQKYICAYSYLIYKPWMFLLYIQGISVFFIHFLLNKKI